MSARAGTDDRAHGGAREHDAPKSDRPPTETGQGVTGEQADVAPGDQQDAQESIGRSIANYLAGFGLAAAMTVASFGLAGTGWVYGPSLAVALTVLAIAQMGVHLVFFLHIDTSPDSTNNVLALAFGLLIVFLLVAGSLWIMANLNGMMPPIGGSTGGHHH